MIIKCLFGWAFLTAHMICRETMCIDIHKCGLTVKDVTQTQPPTESWVQERVNLLSEAHWHLSVPTRRGQCLGMGARPRLSQVSSVLALCIAEDYEL